MFEVEYKYFLRERELFLNSLKELNIELDAPVIQEDIIFVHKDTEGFNIIKGTPVIRIRNTKDYSVLTLKKRVDGANSIEHETVIQNPEEMTKILELLELKKVVEVSKTRRKSLFGGVTICYDQVRGLGDYIELEVVVSTQEEVDIVIQKIQNLAKELGLSENDIEKRKYDTLVFDKTSEV